MPEIGAPVSLGHVHLLSVRIATVNPGAVIVASALHYQSVVFPMSHRVAHPSRIGILGQLSSIREDLTIRQVFGERQNQPRRLHDLHEAEANEAAGETLRARTVRAQVLLALLRELF